MADFHQKLEGILKQDERFISDEGELIKSRIIDKAEKLDENLITCLLDNKDTKAKFFKNINGNFIFNIFLFVDYMQDKKFLIDSYTKFSNKIGLTIDGKTLNQRDEVALVWPFKDCVLEGGMDSEEIKRKEIFFNEILAEDEITRLYEPKVLTNAKKYNAKGSKEFNDFNRNETGTITDNLIIKGNNLLALHSLYKEFSGKVKLIYIDPPYNTGGNENSFAYNNTFNHSSWLTFMKNRLEIGKQLLREDGFIAIAIDHFELGYLLVLSDEIFGQKNRIGIVSVVNNPMGRNQANYFSTTNDYMIVYAREKSKAKFRTVILDPEFVKTFNEEDSIGKFKWNDFMRVGGGDADLRINKETHWYPLYVKPDLTDISIEKKKSYIEVYPVTISGQERTWKVKKESAKEILSELMAEKECNEENDKEGAKKYNRIIIYEKYRIEKGQKATTIWSHKKYNANHKGIRLLRGIIGNQEFSFPKSLYTMQDTLKLMTSNNDIILDFFAGSGTTGHATLELNEEDGGNRQFILVEQMNYIENVTKNRMQLVIKENNNGEFIYFELKEYNEEFINRIRNAKDSEALKKIWKYMKENSFLKYNVDYRKQEKAFKKWEKLNFEEQKKALISLLDKNHLYVNYSEMEDKIFECTDEEKKLTIEFYSKA